jgi:hypothetical protein
VNEFDLYITYVPWDEGGGKTRPVLVLARGEKLVSIFKITTQYENKSERVRAKYFKINEWEEAGLHKQSYVDTTATRNIPLTAFQNKQSIGRLTKSDVARLIKFM